MKNSILWLFIVVVILIIGIGIYGIIHPLHNGSFLTATSTVATTTATSATNSVSFSCDDAKSMTGVFASSSLALTVSDGRNFDMTEATSGSGIRYESSDGNTVFIGEGNDAMLQEGSTTTYNNCVAGTTSTGSSASSLTYTDPSSTFSFSYPTEFSVAGGGIGYSTDWEQEATTSGMLLVTLDIPKTFEPNTNFGDAKFTLGTSADPVAVSSCTTSGFGNQASSTQVIINGVPFTKITFSDAGAGNFYDTTSYRTVKNSQCYAVEYTIHSSNIQNYPSDSGISAFDQAKVQNILEGIVQSFKFL